MSELKNIKYDPVDYKIIINNEKLDIDLITYGNALKYSEYLERIYYFGGIIAQDQLLELSTKKATQTKDDIKAMKELRLIKVYKQERYNIIALSKRALVFLEEKNDVIQILQFKNHAQMLKQLMFIDAFLYEKKQQNERFRYKIEQSYKNGKIRFKTFEKYDCYEKVKMFNYLIRNIDTFIKEIKYFNNYKSFEKVRDKKTNKYKYERCEESIEIKDYFANEIEKVHSQTDIFSDLKMKNILFWIQGRRKDTKISVIIHFLVLDIELTPLKIKKVLKEIDLILAELNNFNVDESNQYIKSRIIIMSKSKDRKKVIEKNLSKINEEFKKEKELAKKEKLLLYSSLENDLPELKFTCFVGEIEVIERDTERFFRTQSDNLKSNKIKDNEFITFDELMKK